MRRERVREFEFPARLKPFRDDFGSLAGPLVGTGQDQVEAKLELPHGFGDVSQFVFAFFGQGAIGVAGVAGRARLNGQPMPQ